MNVGRMWSRDVMRERCGVVEEEDRRDVDD
mgnify:CR=1 FL=1